MWSTLRVGALTLTALIAAAACTGSGASPTPAPTIAAPASQAPASQAPASLAAVSPSPDACAKTALTLVATGKLTVGTDNPAFPPYYAPRASGNTPPWDASQGDPTTGEGFESAVAYAIADKLGFSKDEVVWLYIPFDKSYAPGTKSFDLDLNQVSYKPERAATADLSDGYYFGAQSVVTLKANKFAKATSIAELQGARIGAQVGTTSYDAITNVIKPSTDPRVYDTNDAAIAALKNKQIDAIVVDLPTADFITNVELDGSVIVGQLDQGTPEHFSAVLAKGSSLTPCVNGAIKALTDDGTLAALVTKWLPFSAVAVLAP
jgi:polar amino acid transport system substrate-binding protein